MGYLVVMGIVRGWGMHYVNGSPHKDTRTNVCVCVCCAGHEVSDSTMAELTLYTIGVGVGGGGGGAAITSARSAVKPNSLPTLASQAASTDTVT